MTALTFDQDGQGRWWGVITNTSDNEADVMVEVRAADGSEWTGQPVAPLAAVCPADGSLLVGYAVAPKPGLVVALSVEDLRSPRVPVWSLEAPFARFDAGPTWEAFTPDLSFRLTVDGVTSTDVAAPFDP